MNILIVKMSALGDVVHALPVLDYLHQVSPGCQVDWVVEERFAPLLAGNPRLDRLFTVQTKEWRRHPFSPETWKVVGSLRRELRERRYDLVLDLQGNLKSGLLDWLAGGERTCGFDRDDVREAPNLLFTDQQVPLRRQDYHVTARALRLASACFGRDYGDLPLACEIVTAAEDDAMAAALLATLGDGLAFLCHPGTTWPTKEWHEQGWRELGQELLARYPESSLLFSWGNEAERLLCERLCQQVGERSRLTPAMSLKGLVALCKKVDMVIGGDTGPVHIAAAVGTPTVSLFRATDPKRNAPRGDLHQTVQTTYSCRICLEKRCDRDSECRASITPAMVLAAVTRLLPPAA